MPKAELLELQAVEIGPISSGRLEFAPGFNVLTGETGAGKTLLVGALSLCLGANDGRGIRRDGATRAAAIFCVDGTELAFARESAAGGRLRGTIDALATSASALRERAADLIVIHGQHDSLRLRSGREALRLLDQYGDVHDDDYQSVLSRIRDLERSRATYGGDPSARAREIEFLRFQLAEIEAVAPSSPEELTVVLERLRTLSVLRDHHDDLRAAVTTIDGDDDDTSLAQLARGLRRIPDEGHLGQIRQRLDELAQEIRELVRELSRETDEWQLDPGEETSLEIRAAALQQLARKYGGSLADALVQRDEITRSLLDHDAATETLESLDEELLLLHERAEQLAGELLAQRTESGDRFGRAVAAQFSRVALANALFDVRVSGPDGSSVEFLFAASSDGVPGPLHSLASGGELARVLLAISLETVSEGVVAVFDEIDAGVGGAVAQQIGECLRELSTRQQVIVVTHLASIAAKADRQFVVEKISTSVVATTTVRVVEGEDRVSEIARMLAGESDLRESRALAQRLLSDH